MRTTPRDILCVVVTYNSDAHIVQCLRNVVPQVSRVLVWDNGSVDTTVAIVQQEFPSVEVFASPMNLGYGAAINSAVQKSGHRGDILVLNPDCTLPRGTVDSMSTTMKSLPDVGIVAPAMTLASGAQGIPGGPFPTLLKEGLAATKLDERFDGPRFKKLLALLDALPIKPRFIQQMAASNIRRCVSVDWVSGFCMLINVHAWNAVGGFDPDIFLYFEDVAFCRSARLAGWLSCCDGRVSAEHDESSATNVIGKSAVYYDGMWTYFRKYGNRTQRIAARLARWSVKGTRK